MAEDKKRRPSHRCPRHPEYDYTSPGYYFITSCTYGRSPYFADPAVRAIIERAWDALPRSFPHVRIVELVIMPDHVHCLLQLINGNTHLLGDILRVFKSNITKGWKQLLASQGTPTDDSPWQDSFHDRIIRSDREFHYKHRYMLNNPIKHAMKAAGYEPPD